MITISPDFPCRNLNSASATSMPATLPAEASHNASQITSKESKPRQGLTEAPEKLHSCFTLCTIHLIAQARMRIKELSQVSGLPKTTIHYYTREGLLHPPTKETANSARYDESHVKRLRLVQALRSQDGPALPVFHVRRAIELVESGVPLERAVALQVAVMNQGNPVGAAASSLADLSQSAGCSRARAAKALRMQVLIKAPHEDHYESADVEAARRVQDMLAAGVTLDELAAVAGMIRQISAFEMGLAAKLAARSTPAERAALFHTLQSAGNALHEYWFMRARQHEIAGSARPAPPQELEND